MAFTEIFVLLAVVLTLCVYSIFANDLEWTKLTSNDIVESSNSYVSPFSLAMLRLSMGGLIWATMIFLLLDREGLRITVLCRGKCNS